MTVLKFRPRASSGKGKIGRIKGIEVEVTAVEDMSTDDLNRYSHDIVRGILSYKEAHNTESRHYQTELIYDLLAWFINHSKPRTLDAFVRWIRIKGGVDAKY